MIYILAHIYIYQIMITYKLKSRHIFKNAILIVLSKLPQSILFLMSLLFVYVVLPILVTLYGTGILFTIIIIIEIALSDFKKVMRVRKIYKLTLELSNLKR